MIAKWAGKCGTCHEDYPPGTTIRLNTDTGFWDHEECIATSTVDSVDAYDKPTRFQGSDLDAMGY